MKRLELNSVDERMVLHGYGGGQVHTLGLTKFELLVDKVTATVNAVIVPDTAQHDPLLIGQPFTELPNIVVTKDHRKLTFIQRDGGEERSDARNTSPGGKLSGLSEDIQLIKTAGVSQFTDLKIGDVSEEMKTKLQELVYEFRDCFARSVSELGSAKEVEMTIRLSDETPFSHRPYRMAPSEQALVTKMVDELVENGIVRESASEFASPALLVKKKTGDQRLCIDYRRLNEQTVKDSYPLPRVDDQVDRLTGGKYFVSLDLKSGYYQIPITEASRKYTSFVTHHGQWEWTKMPFGLTNAPRVFQRYMNRILQPVQHLAAVYLDDVLIHAATAPEAIDRLRNVLQIFRNYGLTLNPDKCDFLTRNVTFLGYEVEDGTIRPGKTKIAAVEDFPRPRTVHNIRQFLGLTGYFRHFVKDYAAICRPLTLLLKQEQAWQWEETQEEAFQRLKRSLVERPILTLYQSGAKTEVHTDASGLGLAGILLQRSSDERLHQGGCLNAESERTGGAIKPCSGERATDKAGRGTMGRAGA